MKSKIIFLFFFLLVLFEPNLKSQNYPEEVKQYHQAVIFFQNGMKKYQSGNLDSAKIFFEKSYSLLPENPMIIYNFAAINSKLNDSEKALNLLNKLAEMKLIYHPENDSDFVNLYQNENFKKIISNFKSNAQKIQQSKIAFKLDEKDLITEGVAYSSKSKSFFISSVHKKKILKIDSLGKVSDFIKEGEYGIFGVLGISVDEVRNLLWVTTAVPNKNSKFKKSDIGKSGIFKFNLQTGKLIESYFPEKSPNNFFGDLVLAKNGDVYISDSNGKGIYKFSTGGEKIEEFIPKESFISPQGIAISEDQKNLFLADYALGIFKIDIQTKNMKLISAPENVCELGIDGLYFYKNNLIGIQNGVNPNRVTKFLLNEKFDEIKSAEILEANTEYVDDPTLGVIVKDEFYFIANSQWNKIDRQGNPAAIENWDNPVILKLNLEKD